MPFTGILLPYKKQPIIREVYCVVYWICFCLWYNNFSLFYFFNFHFARNTVKFLNIIIIYVCGFVSLTKPLISQKQRALFLLVTTHNMQTGCGTNLIKKFQNQTAASAYLLYAVRRRYRSKSRLNGIFVNSCSSRGQLSLLQHALPLRLRLPHLKHAPIVVDTLKWLSDTGCHLFWHKTPPWMKSMTANSKCI